MPIPLKNTAIELPNGKLLAFRGALGIRLTCTEGRVWLTVEGQPGDFLLAKGEHLRIESNGLALVQGFPSGIVRMVGEKSCSIRSVARSNRSCSLLALIRTLTSQQFVGM
jgi:hypothetical protein